MMLQTQTYNSSLYSEIRADISSKPGEFTAQLFKQIEGEFIAISDKVDVNVNLLNQDLFDSIGSNKDNDFWKKLYSIRAKANDYLAEYCGINGADFGRYMMQNSACKVWEKYYVWNRY